MADVGKNAPPVKSVLAASVAFHVVARLQLDVATLVWIHRVTHFTVVLVDKPAPQDKSVKMELAASLVEG